MFGFRFATIIPASTQEGRRISSYPPVKLVALGWHVLEPHVVHVAWCVLFLARPSAGGAVL